MQPRTPEAPLAANLRSALAAAELTQEALARELDISLRAVQTWCSGQSLPRWAQLVRVAAVLKRDPSWFYAEHDEVAA